MSPGTDVTASSYVLLTPQDDPGTRRFWAKLDTAANTVTIRLSASDVSVIAIAWLLIG